MRHRVIRYSSFIAGLAFLSVFFGLAIHNTPSTNAIAATDFKAGNIIDDGMFYNKNTMTVAQIQAHLNKYSPACDTWGTGAVGSGRYINGKAVPASTTRASYAKQMRAAGNSRYHDPPYICVQNYYENPTTHETLYSTKNVIKSGMVSAAQIIYDAAQKYGVNPQVLLVMLKKESYVWGDNWPLKDEYNTVMGYACPDTAPCNSKYFGFYNQVEMSAWQLKYYKEHINSYNYRPYTTNSILYSPTASCGRKSVYLENIATTSLYIYTPYTPNDAALRNYPGTATCGSYGNRNFFMYFSEWFGSTHNFSVPKISVPESSYTIQSGSGAKMQLATVDKNSGTKIVAKSTDNGTTSFSLKKNTDNSYTLWNNYSGLVLDVPAGNAVVGANIQQYASNGTNAQKWYVYGNNSGGYFIASALNASYVLSIDANGQIVLDIYGSSSSVPLKLLPIYSEKLADDEYLISSAINSEMLIDIAAGANVDKANADIYKRNGSNAQKFRLNYDSASGFYKISTPYGRVLDIAAAAMANATNVQIYTSNNSCAQRFAIIKNIGTDNYSIYSACNLGYSFDIPSGSAKSGANLQIYSANGSNAQRWTFETTASRQAKEAEAARKAAEEEAARQSAQPAQLVADGVYFIHSSLKNNFVLDVAGNNTANGTNINVYGKNGTTAQKFNVKYNAAVNAYTFTGVNSGKVIDLSAGKASNGSNIHIWKSNGTCAQYWKIQQTTAGKYRIVSTCNEKFVIDVAAGSKNNGANVQLYTANGTAAQEWSFVK